MKKFNKAGHDMVSSLMDDTGLEIRL